MYLRLVVENVWRLDHLVETFQCFRNSLRNIAFRDNYRDLKPRPMLSHRNHRLCEDLVPNGVEKCCAGTAASIF